MIDKGTGQLVGSGGSPGGALIIHYTAKTLYGILNWGLNTQRAINLPNFASLNGPSILEEKRFRPPRWKRCARAGPRCVSKRHVYLNIIPIVSFGGDRKIEYERIGMPEEPEPANPLRTEEA